uniref:BZIP domain-containing protein n=1 Tax=Phytophthora ramorum TaxID=164328 RepID=H3GN91_PHYRM
MEVKELKRQASLNKRRRRNREAMQRARQRDKEHMEALRLEAQRLEQTHRHLLSKVDQTLAQMLVPGVQTSHISELQRRLEQTREQANRLMRQNLSFQNQMAERVKGEDRMEGLLKELARDQNVQEKVYAQLCRENPNELRLEFGFTQEKATQDEKLYFSFKKVFRNRSAMQMADRNWANEIKFVTYRSASEAATQQFHVLQKFNEDTYLIAREKLDPDDEGKVVRLLYLRFRLFESNRSYAVVTQSVPQEPSLYGGSLEKIWANDACMWNHFVPVIDENGEENCEIHLTGSSTIGDPRSVRTNVLETVMGLLRWENINVGPTLSLTQASRPEMEKAGLGSASLHVESSD